MERVADAGPTTVGVKVTLMVQLAPAASVAVQVVVSPKLAAFVPPRVMTMPVRVAPPLLVRVTTWAADLMVSGWAVNVRLDGWKLATGTAATFAMPATLRTRM